LLEGRFGCCLEGKWVDVARGVGAPGCRRVKFKLFIFFVPVHDGGGGET
jgi:hypothetical protein